MKPKLSYFYFLLHNFYSFLFQINVCFTDSIREGSGWAERKSIENDVCLLLQLGKGKKYINYLHPRVGMILSNIDHCVHECMAVWPDKRLNPVHSAMNVIDICPERTERRIITCFTYFSIMVALLQEFVFAQHKYSAQQIEQKNSELNKGLKQQKKTNSMSKLLKLIRKADMVTNECWKNVYTLKALYKFRVAHLGLWP